MCINSSSAQLERQNVLVQYPFYSDKICAGIHNPIYNYINYATIYIKSK